MQYITGTYFNSSFLTGKKSLFYIYKCTLIRSFQTTTLAQVDYVMKLNSNFAKKGKLIENTYISCAWFQKFLN